MPIIKSAKKKLRQDLKRKLRNKRYGDSYKKIVSKFRQKATKKTKDLISKAYSQIDKAVKKKIIHKKKANRLKSRLSK